MPTALSFKRYDVASAPLEATVAPGVIRAQTPIPAESPDPLVKGLINLFRADPGQKRTKKQYNLLLSTLAQRRADDMRQRGYFDHVNPDGVGPDSLAIQIGYPLHPGYGNGRSANHIESIAAGAADAGSCWTLWLNSPAHKTHVLGLNSFFAEQIDFGIGHAVGGAYGHYWVLITAKS